MSYWLSMTCGKEELTFKLGLERPAMTFTFQAEASVESNAGCIWLFRGCCSEWPR